MKNSLKNFCPLNDSREIALGLANRINTHINRDEEELIQVEVATRAAKKIRKQGQERRAEVLLDLVYCRVIVV